MYGSPWRMPTQQHFGGSSMVFVSCWISPLQTAALWEIENIRWVYLCNIEIKNSTSIHTDDKIT